MLKPLLRSLCFLLVLAACKKTETTSGPVLADLQFAKTTTASIQLQQEGILSRVQAYGPTLCYKFSKFDIRETATREFEVRAKATVPGGDVCLQALYRVDSTFRINTTTKGRYLLHFYTQQQLFKTDTVQVN